ncbi:MAG: hypothetical protein V4614_13275 [Pseudomonadota bacterium]
MYKNLAAPGIGFDIPACGAASFSPASPLPASATFAVPAWSAS